MIICNGHRVQWCSPDQGVCSPAACSCEWGQHAQGVTFSVVLTEGRPDGTGRSMAKSLEKLQIPTVVILDCAVGWAIEALKCAPCSQCFSPQHVFCRS